MHAHSPKPVAQVVRIDDVHDSIGDISVHITPQGLEAIRLAKLPKQPHWTYNTTRKSKKKNAFASHPYCFTCGMELTLSPHQPNSACLCRDALYCPVDINDVRQGKWKQSKQ